VFTWTNLLVVVAELDGGENEALDLVPLVTNAVLEVRITLWMRYSRVFRASDSQCRSRNCPGFNPSILRYSRIWGAADKTVLNTVKKSPLKKHTIPYRLVGFEKKKKIFYFPSYTDIQYHAQYIKLYIYNSFFYWRARVCWPLLCLGRPFCIFYERYLDSNPESCRKLAGALPNQPPISLHIHV
jgi:hypothetical protein